MKTEMIENKAQVHVASYWILKP